MACARIGWRGGLKGSKTQPETQISPAAQPDRVAPTVGRQGWRPRAYMGEANACEALLRVQPNARQSTIDGPGRLRDLRRVGAALSGCAAWHKIAAACSAQIVQASRPSPTRRKYIPVGSLMTSLSSNGRAGPAGLHHRCILYMAERTP